MRSARHLVAGIAVGLCLSAGAGCATTSTNANITTTQRPLQGQAFTIVQEQFAPVFPGMKLVEPQVRWWTSLCPGTSETAVILSGKCYAGLEDSTSAVEVAWRGSVGMSAYTHELMHYFLAQAGRDPDISHTQTELWDLVNRIDTTLQQQGI